MTRSAIESSDDDDREGPLRIRPDGMRESGRQKAKCRDQHGDHDGTQPQNRALDRGID